MDPPQQPSDETGALLARLRAFWFPGGEDSARLVLSLKTTERGEMRASPGSRWLPFTAEQVIDTRSSSFCWQARYHGGSMGLVAVTDAYDGGRGQLLVKLGGLIPVQKFTGPEADRGELQRYLASIVLCPPIVLNHASLVWAAVGPLTLQVRDRADPAGATVDFEISEDGRPLVCRADRPRAVGRRTVMTPWSASGSDFQDWEGLRLPRRMEAAWDLPEGPFASYRAEVVSLTRVL